MQNDSEGEKKFSEWLSATSYVAREIMDERLRQIMVEGWTAKHDDGHRYGQMARAAAAYCLAGFLADGSIFDFIWPNSWGKSWFKVGNSRRNLVKAGALIVAEIERLDRAAESN